MLLGCRLRRAAMLAFQGSSAMFGRRGVSNPSLAPQRLPELLACCPRAVVPAASRWGPDLALPQPFSMAPTPVLQRRLHGPGASHTTAAVQGAGASAAAGKLPRTPAALQRSFPTDMDGAWTLFLQLLHSQGHFEEAQEER